MNYLAGRCIPPGSLTVMNPLKVREGRAAFRPSCVCYPQVKRTGNVYVAALPRIMLQESQAAVTGPERGSIPAMRVRPVAADMRRRSRARIGHLDRVST